MGDTQVVEYNFGRMFQHLGMSLSPLPSLSLSSNECVTGLQSFAIKHYNACLALSTSDRLALRASRMEIDDSDDEEGEAGEEGPEDYGRAAAYNLVALYMLSGQAELARVVACRWLTF
jgi:general transcription factor 3C polypeptide 3 (transcription factor C subunit 4)